MDNDTLDAHIKTLLERRRDAEKAAKKLKSQASSAENKRQKMLEKLTELGLKPDEHSTMEDLQTLHSRHNESEKLRAKNERDVKKFRKQLDELILKNPDAGIKNVPNDAGPNTLETAVKNARETRDLFKKAQKEQEKQLKAQERADKKAAEQQKKNDEKAQKQANKAAGLKGSIKMDSIKHLLLGSPTKSLSVISTNPTLMMSVVRASTTPSDGRKCPIPRRRIHKLLGTEFPPKFLSTLLHP